MAMPPSATPWAVETAVTELKPRRWLPGNAVILDSDNSEFRANLARYRDLVACIAADKVARA